MGGKGGRTRKVFNFIISLLNMNCICFLFIIYYCFLLFVCIYSISCILLLIILFILLLLCFLCFFWARLSASGEQAFRCRATSKLHNACEHAFHAWCNYIMMKLWCGLHRPRQPHLSSGRVFHLCCAVAIEWQKGEEEKVLKGSTDLRTWTCWNGWSQVTVGGGATAGAAW